MLSVVDGVGLATALASSGGTGGAVETGGATGEQYAIIS